MRRRTRNSALGTRLREPATFTPNGDQGSRPVTEGPQVTLTEQASALKGGHLDNSEPSGERADIEECLYLKTFDITVEGRQHVAPESHVSVAQIGIPPAERQPNCPSERSIAHSAEDRHVGAATTLQEARTFRDVGTCLER